MADADELDFDPEEAHWLWSEYVRVTNLHHELASLYRNKSRDKRTINRLWTLIEEGEYGLLIAGVRL